MIRNGLMFPARVLLESAAGTFLREHERPRHMALLNAELRRGERPFDAHIPRVAWNHGIIGTTEPENSTACFLLLLWEHLSYTAGA